MKRMLVVFTLLAMVLPLSLFATGGSESGGTTAAAELDANGKFLTTRNISVEIFDRGLDAGRTPAENNVWTDWIKATVLKDLNVAITFIPVPRWTETDTINNLLAAGDAPDICYTYSYNTIQTYANMGGVVDLNPIIEKNKSMLKDMFNLLGDVNIYNNLDPVKKTLWAVEARLFHPFRNTVFVREDWLKKLNLKSPTTVAQFESMLVAFKDNAKLLLGADSGKMVPMSISTDVGWRDDPLFAAFIPNDITDETMFKYGYDDRRLMWPGYKEAIRLLNKWYNMGLIWKDFPIYNDQTYEDNMMKAGYVGSFMHNWDYPYRGGGVDIQTTLQQQVGPDAAFVAVDSFPNSAGVYRKYLPGTFDRKVFFPNTNDEALASILYVNWLCKLDNRKFLQIGKEGVNHIKMDDGAIKIIAATDPAWIQNAGQNIDYTMVINGLDLGNTDLNAKSIALGYPGIDPKYPALSYTIMRKDGRSAANYNVGEITSQAGMDNVLRDKRNNFLVQSIVASVADFNKVYDAGYGDYLKSGGQAIIDERTAKWDALYKK